MKSNVASMKSNVASIKSNVASMKSNVASMSTMSNEFCVVLTMSNSSNMFHFQQRCRMIEQKAAVKRVVSTALSNVQRYVHFPFYLFIKCKKLPFYNNV